MDPGSRLHKRMASRTVSSPKISGGLFPVNPMGILVTYIQADQVVDF